MAVENYTGAAWSDYGGAYVDNAANVLTVSASQTDTFSVHRVFAENHFDGNFEHLLKTKFDSSSTAAILSVWGLSNKTTAAAHDTYAMIAADETFLRLYWYRSGGASKLYLYEYQAGENGGYDVSGVISQNTYYYLEIERDESTGTYGTLLCRIYSDESRTTLVDTLSATLSAKNDFRTIYGVIGHDLNQAVWTFTGESSYLDLGLTYGTPEWYYRRLRGAA